MLSEEQDADLRTAVELLENPGLAIRLASLVGKPLEAGIDALPSDWKGVLDDGVEKALNKALSLALLTIRDGKRAPRSDWMHLGAVGATGFVGGAGGLYALPFELPITTSIMFRSIADIARGEGEDVRAPETAVACIEVFALGSGKTAADDAAETAYYAQRAALAKVVTEAGAYMARIGTKAVDTSTTPVLVSLITQVASRFGIQVNNKVIAQAVPVVGAFGGASVNAIFMAHYQNVALGHFMVRRLERELGAEVVARRYRDIAAGLETPTDDPRTIEATPSPPPEPARGPEEGA